MRVKLFAGVKNVGQRLHFLDKLTASQNIRSCSLQSPPWQRNKLHSFGSETASYVRYSTRANEFPFLVGEL